MDNGSINIYNPKRILHGQNDGSIDAALLASIEGNNGAITALQFNPHGGSENILATGSSKGEILITSLDNPAQPTVTVPSNNTADLSGAEITQMAWNPEVAHIVASSAGNGIVTIWDLKQNKPWCELRCELSGASVSDLAWNPVNGMHLITASADDRNPVMKLWDLRASMSMPLATLEGHTQGILSMSWCPHDDNLLLSSGKDNKTYLWDIQTLKPFTEIPHDDQSSNQSIPERSSSELYGASGLTSSQQKRYDIKWSPIRRGIISTCSFDRKVQIHSIVGSADKCGRPPKWMKPSCGASFGFGGAIVKFSSENKTIDIESYVEEPFIKAAVLEYENKISQNDYAGYAAEKASNAAYKNDIYDEQIWSFLNVMFDSQYKSKLLSLLGFDYNAVSERATQCQVESEKSKTLGISQMSPHAESAVNDALLVGNFDAAVECCIRVGNFADALVLASCGGAELWTKTQSRYFECEIQKRPYLSLVSSVVQGQLIPYVNGSDPAKWREVLAYLCTYASAEDFPSFCNALGDHLEASGNDAEASLCFICAYNLEKAASYWLKQLDESDEHDHMALHNFVLKFDIFMQTGSRNYAFSKNISEPLFKYAKILADQGLFQYAAKYCRSDSQECKELSDRLYRSKDSQICTQALGFIPEFPYQYTIVGVAPKPKATAPVAANTIQQPRTPAQSAYVRTHPQTTTQTSHPNAQSYASSAQSNEFMASHQPATYQQIYTHHTSTEYGGSQDQSAAQYHSGALASASIDELPTGWVSLQDPASGRTYYANSVTGETTWDKPFYMSTAASSAAQTQLKVGSNLASKYGDGFVTSASHPELAAQYGNIGTSNPYTDSSRPGIAVVNRVQKSPVSGTFNLQKLAQIADSIEYKSLVEDLLSSVSTLSSANFGPADQKSLGEIEKGVAIFAKRLGNGDIEKDVAEKMQQVMDMIKKGDFISATSFHTKLVNSVWKDHKDWLKGIKFLIQLNSKLMQGMVPPEKWAYH